jgi:hypothetical protein
MARLFVDRSHGAIGNMAGSLDICVALFDLGIRVAFPSASSMCFPAAW